MNNNLSQPFSNNGKKQKLTFRQKIKNFLNGKTGTILAAIIGLCIGFAFKDFVDKLVNFIIEPIFILIIKKTSIGNFGFLANFINNHSSSLNLLKFINSSIALLFIIIVTYIIYNLIAG